MKLMIDLMQNGKPASDIMTIIERDEHPFRDELARAGRNDPCPCGSGQKVKRCHEAPEPALRKLPTIKGDPRPPATDRGRRAAEIRGQRNT
jgi:uncharacterized protein